MTEKGSLCALATDLVVFNIKNDQLCVLLVQRATEPFMGKRCLPGGFVKEDQLVENTAYQVLHKETHIIARYLKQFGIFDDPKRDPRQRVIGIGYYSIIHDEDLVPQPGATQYTSMFMPLKQLPEIAFDHELLIRTAYQQLKKDMEGSDIVRYFLPKLFTIDVLKKYCELIYGYEFDKRNFARFIKRYFKLKKTKQKEQYVAHRPAFLYKFA